MWSVSVRTRINLHPESIVAFTAEVCEAVIKDRLYLFTVSSHDDNSIQSDHPLFSKEHHSISSSSNPDVHLSSSIVSAKCQYPTLNFACPLGLRTPLPRQSQRLWLTRDHRQDFFLSRNQLSLKILVVYCHPFSLSHSLTLSFSLFLSLSLFLSFSLFLSVSLFLCFSVSRGLKIFFGRNCCTTSCNISVQKIFSRVLGGLCLILVFIF